MAKRYHPFYFLLADRREHPARVQGVRDGAPLAALVPAILRLGHAPGRPVFNFPGPERELALDDFGEEDLIVVPTRPPLDDGRTRKTILTSGGRLEVSMFEAIRHFFTVLARDR